MFIQTYCNRFNGLNFSFSVMQQCFSWVFGLKQKVARWCPWYNTSVGGLLYAITVLGPALWSLIFVCLV